MPGRYTKNYFVRVSWMGKPKLNVPWRKQRILTLFCLYRTGIAVPGTEMLFARGQYASSWLYRD